MQKYNDIPAAIALMLFTLGGLFYAAQLIFTTEAWLTGNGIGKEAVALARGAPPQDIQEWPYFD